MTNIIDFDQSPELEGLHMAPSILLKGGYQPSQVSLQCLMCNNRTHNPTTFSKRLRGEAVDRFPDMDERDRLMGYCAGTSDDGSGLADDIRMRATGGAIAAELLWLLAIHLKVPSRPSPCSEMCLSTLDIMTADVDKLELYLFNLSDADLLALMKAQIAKYGPMPELKITVAADKLPFQSKCRITIQQKLQIPAEKKMDQLVANGSREDVPYGPDLWIHDCLMLLKTPERIDAETGELAIRPIGVLCAINSAHEYDSYLAEEMPTIQAHKETLPVTAEYMIISDAADGYHACVVEKSSRKYLCVGYYSAVKKRYRIMQCVRMPQGLKYSGVWYPAWVNHGFNRCFGYAWRSWVLTHVDDLLTTADSRLDVGGGSDALYLHRRL